MTSSEAETEHHPEFSSSRNARDHSDVLKVLDGCINHFENPFDLDNVPASLTNITTGKVAPKEIENSLTQIPGSGKNPRKIFDGTFGGRFLSLYIKKELRLWDAQKKTTILTFGIKHYHLTRKRSCLLTLKFVSSAFAISQQRDIDLRTVLQYELVL